MELREGLREWQMDQDVWRRDNVGLPRLITVGPMIRDLMTIRQRSKEALPCPLYRLRGVTCVLENHFETAK
jgi:hypothetical protein